MKLRAISMCLGLSCALASVAGAQELRGFVSDSASRQPISGAVLVLLDSAGQTLGRNITNERGEYRITLVHAIRRMRVLHIGFRPRLLDVPAIDSGVARLDVTMVTLPAFLEPVRVVDQRNCPRRDDATTAFALWEQAKAALLATVVAREANPAKVLRLGFDRRMKDREHVISQTVRMDSASTARPFIALRPAAEFVEHGFVTDSGGSRLLAAPDADVMLDDAFVAGYCFHIANADRSRPQEIGLGFSAASRRRGRVEIEGEVWIDSTTRSLKRVEYRYVGLNALANAFEPGGHIEFRTMPNGTIMIDRWFIRVAVPDSTRPVTMFTRTVALEAHEIGGEVASARWPDGPSWHGSLATLRGKLVAPGPPGTVVQLIGTPYQAAADSSGTFEISNLLPGPYTIAVVDPRLADLGVLLKTGIEFTAVRDSTTTILVEVPSAERYVAASCETNANALSGATLTVRTNLPDGSPARGAKIAIHPQRDDDPKHVIRGETDKNGLVHMCHAPLNAMLEVRADYPGMMPATGVREITTNLVTLVLQLKRTPDR